MSEKKRPSQQNSNERFAEIAENAAAAYDVEIAARRLGIEPTLLQEALGAGLSMRLLEALHEEYGPKGRLSGEIRAHITLAKKPPEPDPLEDWEMDIASGVRSGKLETVVDLDEGEEYPPK